MAENLILEVDVGKVDELLERHGFFLCFGQKCLEWVLESQEKPKPKLFAGAKGPYWWSSLSEVDWLLRS